jgi:hypothetical protein
MRHSRRGGQSGPGPLMAVALAAGLLLAFPCVLAVLLTHSLAGRLTERRGFWPLLALVGTFALVCFFLVAHPFRTLHDQLVDLLSEVVLEAKAGSWSIPRLWDDLRPIWLESLLFAPAAAFVKHLFTPQSPGQRLLVPRQQRAAALHRAGRRVQRRMGRRRLPEQVCGQMALGLPIQGDLHEWIVRGLFVLPTQELSRHGVVLGASGSGKSETLLRLAVGAARVLGWQVIYIDGKGDEDAGVRFVAAMKSAGVQRVKLFPAEAYNGWVGNEQALLSRLLAVEEFSDTHYRAVAENLLGLAITAPGGPVRKSADLLLRLNLTNELLPGLYAGYPAEEGYLAYISRKDPLGVYNRYAALLGKLGGKLDGAWSYDSVDAAYISLDGLALSGIVSGLGRYFVEDFANYAGQRKPGERRVLFIFDDLGAIDADLTNMFERVRSRGVSVYVSGQSDHSIAYRGMAQNAERILSSATTIILHACSRSREIVARAGTEVMVEEASYIAEDGETGRGAVRLREVPRVDPNEVMKLPVGEAYVIAHGKAQRIRVMPVTVGAKELAEAGTYIAHAGQQPRAVQPAVRQRAPASPGRKAERASPASAPSSPSADDDPDEDLLN